MDVASHPDSRPRRGRKARNRVFIGVCILATSLSCITLGVLLFTIARDGFEHLSWSFLTEYTSRKPEKAGMHAVAPNQMRLLRNGPSLQL